MLFCNFAREKFITLNILWFISCKSNSIETSVSYVMLSIFHLLVFASCQIDLSETSWINKAGKVKIEHEFIYLFSFYQRKHLIR